MKFKILTVLIIPLLFVACEHEGINAPKRMQPPKLALTVVCNSRREYSYDANNGIWTDEQTGEMYDYDPSAPCSAFPTTTLHYDQGQIVGYSPGTVAAHDYTANDQMAWTDAKSWVFGNGMTGSYTSGVEDQEVLYGSQDLRDAIDRLRRGSSSFDNAMRALENDPNVQLKVMWGFVNDPFNPAWTQLLGLNNRGQMVVLVVIDPGNLDRMASDPYYQERGGANFGRGVRP